jgi:hypothetical protein
MPRNKIAFLNFAVHQAAENNEPIEGAGLKGLAELLDDIYCDLVEVKKEEA